jgi:beta-lactam-binding protein with PASTA domain
MVVVALLGFMWTRPGTEPAGEKRAPITSRTTTRSDMMVMPDLRDLTFSEVVSRLGDMNLVLGRAVEAQGQPGIVMATDPGLGRLVRPGTQVIVYVGASEALIDESDDHGLLGE